MAQGRLNREGRESARNYAKAYRPPKVKFDKNGNFVKYDDLDYMIVGSKRDEATGKVVNVRANTTGCFGIKSSFGMGRFSIIKRSGLPGRERSSRPKKRGCKLVQGNRTIEQLSKEPTFKQVVNLRADILTAKIMGECIHRHLVGDNALRFLAKINAFLKQKHPDRMEEIIAQDWQREKSTQGMVKGKKINAKSVKSIDQRIRRAMANMNL